MCVVRQRIDLRPGGKEIALLDYSSVNQKRVIAKQFASLWSTRYFLVSHNIVVVD